MFKPRRGRIWMSWGITLCSFLPWGGVVQSPLILPVRAIRCPRISEPPRIDGRLDDIAWTQATKIASFSLVARPAQERSDHQTSAFVAYDDQFLYLAFLCEGLPDEPTEGRHPTWQPDHPDGILVGEHVEVFLDVQHDHATCFRFALGLDGERFDQRYLPPSTPPSPCPWDATWDGFWFARTTVAESSWVAEMAIAFSSFGLDEPVPGTTWGIGLRRSGPLEQGSAEEEVSRALRWTWLAESSVWPDVAASVSATLFRSPEPAAFGDLIFGDIDVFVTEMAIGDTQRPLQVGANSFRIGVKNSGPASRTLRLAVSSASSSGKTSTDWQTVTVRPAADTSISARFSVWESGANRLTIALLDSSSGQELYRGTYMVSVRPFVQFDLEPFYSRRTDPWLLRFWLRASPDVTRSSMLRVRFLREGLSLPLREKSFRDLERPPEMGFVFPLDSLQDLPGGTYLLDCSLVDGTGSTTARFIQRFTKIDPGIPDEFAVVPGPYSFAGQTEDGLQVLFPALPGRFAFWRKPSYPPWWDLDQIGWSYGYAREFREEQQDSTELDAPGFANSRLDVIEATEVRAVIRWRHTLSDRCRHDSRGWADEEYILYPDGIGVRSVRLWSDRPGYCELGDLAIVIPPGMHLDDTRPEDLWTVGFQGQSPDGSKLGQAPGSFAYSSGLVLGARLGDRPRPFLALAAGSHFLANVLPGTAVSGNCLLPSDQSRTQRPIWGSGKSHILSQGDASGARKLTLGRVIAEIDPNLQPNSWQFLIGVDTTRDGRLAKLAVKSWLEPPPVRCREGNLQFVGYDRAARAYVLRYTGGAAPGTQGASVVLEASKGRPLLGAVLVIRGWNSPCTDVEIDGTRQSGAVFRSGLTREGDCILYLRGLFDRRTRLRFR